MNQAAHAEHDLTGGRLSGRALASWRRSRALALAMSGCTYDEIAAQVGYANRGSAWKVVNAALRSASAGLATEYRDLELARLDALQAAHWPQAMSGSVKAADLVLRVIDRRIRLLGLDQVGAQSDPPKTLIVNAPVGDSEEYIRQLQAITAMSGPRNRESREATRPNLGGEAPDGAGW